jgi:vacuolar protein sorting-associated protein 45
VSLASTTSHLLSQEVYLTDRLDNSNREDMPQLKCLVFIRPSADSLAALERELERPRYGQYWLCLCSIVGSTLKLMLAPVFTSILKKSVIERLAETDENEVVQEIQVRQDRASVPVGLNPKQEFFADYCPLTTSHVSLNVLPSPLSSESQSMSVAQLSEANKLTCKQTKPSIC